MENHFTQTIEDIGAFIGENDKIGRYTKKSIEGTEDVTLTKTEAPNNYQIDPVDQAIPPG